MRWIILPVLMVSANAALAIPGVDTAEMIKQYLVLVKQLKELKNQVLQTKEMISHAKRVVKDAEGNYGYGNLLDSESDYKKRRWDLGSWKDALKNLSGGNTQRYKALLNAYKKDHFILSDKEYSKGTSRSLTKSYSHLVKVNRAATVFSDKAYATLNPSMDTIHVLAKKIETTPNTKAALDLNSRLMAELGYISIKQLRMQTVMNHQLAEKTSGEITEKADNAIFNRLPKEEKK